MTDALTKRLLARATYGDDVLAGELRAAVRQIKDLQEQLREKEKQIEDWERAAQRWVTQIDLLTRKMDELHGIPPGQGRLYFMNTSKLPEFEE